jgi:VanZ family protein
VPHFSSGRERRLWACVLAIVVAIYSTLAFTPTLTRALRDSGLIEEAVMLGMLLVMATILTQGLKARPGGAEIGVLLGVVAVYLLMFARMNATLEERTHLMEYGVVAVFVYEALTERTSQGRRVPVPAVVAALGASLLGVLDECIQAFLPNRVFDPIDILFNVLAAVTSIAAMVALGWAQRLTSRLRQRGA